MAWFGRYHYGESIIFECGQFRTFCPGFGFWPAGYHVDQHGQLNLKHLRLSVLNEMHTNLYTGPRLSSLTGFDMTLWSGHL